MASFNDISSSIAAVQAPIDTALAQLHSIIQSSAPGSSVVQDAQSAISALQQAGGLLANAQGTVASAAAGAQAGAAAAAAAAAQAQAQAQGQAQGQAPSQAVTAPASAAASSGTVSTGAAATIALGTSIVGGIIGWVAKGASVRERPRAAAPNPLRRRGRR